LEYEVERILKSKLRQGRKYYLIKWKGYPNEENTWEPEESFTNADEILKAFKNSELSEIVP